MATVKIDYGTLADASRRCNKAADELEDYADALPQRVSSPLSSLTGGASAFTSSAVSLAGDKARSLRTRATSYRTMAGQITSFSSEAKSVDDAVSHRMAKVAESREDGLSFWDKIAYTFFQTINGILDKTGIGKAVREVLNGLHSLGEKIKRGIKAAFDWFKHGAGRYLLDLVLSFADVIASVLTVIDFVGVLTALSSFLFPVGTIIGCILVGAAIFVAAKKTVDFGVTAVSAPKGWALDETEPGLSRYHGETDSISDFAKKYTTDADLQNATKIFDTAADTTDFVLGFVELGMGRNTDGMVDSFSYKNVGKNALGEFGITKHEDGSFGYFEDGPFGINKLFNSSSPYEWGRNSTSTFKNVVGFGNSTIKFGESLSSHSRDKYTPFEVSFDVLKMINQAVPDVGFYGTVHSASDLYFTYKRW